MTKQSLLLVDGDTRSLRVLEVSLRKAGFTVTPAVSVKDALDKLELHSPDLIISETTFPNDVDGFELRRRLRTSTDWAEIPFVFLTAQTAIEHKIKGLELGVDDYLTKPIYIKEIITRINILLQKRQRARFDERKDGVRFAGRVADMPVVDVIQTIEISRKSGVINFVGPHNRQAAIYFRDGKVIDAEAGTLQAEDAVYRLLTWSEGEFEVVFRTVRRREVIQTSSQGLLMEGMRRLDEWSRLLEQLPPLSHRFEVDLDELAARLGEIPDDNNRILRLIDAKRTLLEVIDASDFGDLECIQTISRLYFEGLLVDLDPQRRERRSSERPVPLVIVEDAPTPIEEVASGPIDLVALDSKARDAVAPPPDRREVADRVEEMTADEPPASLEPAEPLDPPGPLLGGYRPSSLRLIDEAVAAAQAIEPSLFEPELAAAPATNGAAVVREPAIPAAIETAESSIPAHVDDFDNIADAPTDPSRKRPVTPPPAPVEIAQRDDSGLRMIGSLGRDRAEASGELSPSGRPQARHDTQRELVTILPRRQTRDIPIVQPPPAAPAAEPPEPALPPPRVTSVEGGVVRDSGPGFKAKLLIVLAAMFATIALFKLCSKRAPATRPTVHDARDVATNDTKEPQVVAPLPAPIAPDAAVARVVVDAAVAAAAPDAAVAPQPHRNPAAPPDIVPDKAKQARELLDRARTAYDDGDFARAFELADESLALRKTARTYLERARSLARLDRLPDALDSIDEAMKIVRDYPPAWFLRGKLLHEAHQDGEARPALRRYLEVDPNGTYAKEARRILGEPEP